MPRVTQLVNDVPKCKPMSVQEHWAPRAAAQHAHCLSAVSVTGLCIFHKAVGEQRHFSLRDTERAQSQQSPCPNPAAGRNDSALLSSVDLAESCAAPPLV